MTNAELLIRKRGYSPTSLSREVGVSPSTLFRWLKGKSMPKRELILRLVSALECSVEEVVFVKDLD